MKFALIAENGLIFAVRAMRQMLSFHPSGFHAWLREPLTRRALEDQRQTVVPKQAWDDSFEVCGYGNLHDDLFGTGEDTSGNGAWRLARLAEIRAQTGCKKKVFSQDESLAAVADNTLNRAFDADAQDQFRVTDIAFGRKLGGFLSWCS